MVARLLEPEFQLVIHRRSNNGAIRLPELAKQLHSALIRSQVAPPYLLVGHSFGALVIRQFAALYPAETAGVLFVDGLPPTTRLPGSLLFKGHLAARTAQLIAAAQLMGPLFPLLERRFQTVQWALHELAKLPEQHRLPIFWEWLTPQFYGTLARTLTALPANLRIASRLPPTAPSLSLWSDYHDPTGTHIEGAGHWIQIDRPELVAAAIRKLRDIIKSKGV